MGCRANFVILSEAGLELYFDRWGAQGMSYDLLLDGEAATLARIRTMYPCDSSANSAWLDDVWAEGGLVLDLVERRLTWFEAPFEGLRPRVAAHLIEKTWTGWTTVWASEGMRGILQVLGIDPIPILLPPVSAAETPPRKEAVALLDTHRAGSIERDGVRQHYTVQSNDLILSVRFDDGSTWSTAVGSWLEDIAYLRPEWVVEYVLRARAENRSGAGPGGAWATDTATHEESNWVHQGIYLDLPAKRLSWWSNGVESDHFDFFRHNWPRFAVVAMGDDYAWQERVAGIHGIQPSAHSLLGWSLAALVRHLGWEKRLNPTNSIAPWAEDMEDDERPPGLVVDNSLFRMGAAEDVFAVLQDLIDAGISELPRVRYVNTYGRIIEPDELQ